MLSWYGVRYCGELNTARLHKALLGPRPDLPLRNYWSGGLPEGRPAPSPPSHVPHVAALGSPGVWLMQRPGLPSI